MEQIITETSSAAESVKELVGVNRIGVPEGEFRFFSMAMIFVITYAVLISLLFDSMGIHG